MRLAKLLCTSLAASACVAAIPANAAGEPDKGAQVFGACAACHSLEPDRHLTGPSLAKIFGRRAGPAKDYVRYSDALKRSGLVWDEKTLDAWIADPKQLIPDNFMTFAGIRDAGQRADLVAFLKAGADAGASSGMGAMMAAPRLESLRDVEAQARVTAIRYCKDSYFVTLANGKTFPFWEFNLRFKTDSSPEGPARGKPVILRAGMQGDRASIVFAEPGEIGKFIKRKCE